MSEHNIEKPYDERSPEPVVTGLITEATDALLGVAEYDQSQVDTLVRAVAKRIYQERESIAQVNHDEIEIGNIDHKRWKIGICCKGIFDDIIGEHSVGIRETEHPGIIEIAKPVGVIGASIPTTNPVSTLLNVALLAIKGRNAIIISSPPHCTETAALTVRHIQEALAANGAPPTLVQMLPVPTTRSREHELMDQVDLVQVTGSSRKVKAGQESGTPNYCVGEGNVVAIVDDTASIEQTAKRIAAGTSFDNGILCTCENSLVAHTDVYPQLLEALEGEGGYHCTPEETESIERVLFSSGSTNPLLMGKSASKIAGKAGIDVPEEETDFLVVEGEGVGPEYPLSGEKLAPVLTAYEADAFETAVPIAKQILDYEGTGHSCVLHTTQQDRAEKVGHDIDVCRVIVNQPGIALASSYENELTNTTSLGAGTWGGNQLDENLSYGKFIATTRIALPIDHEEPAAEELF